MGHVTQSEECVLVVFGDGTRSTGSSKLNIHPLLQVASIDIQGHESNGTTGRTKPAYICTWIARSVIGSRLHARK